MAGLSLNYATFYNSAIRNLTSLSQTDVANVLFHGTTAEDYLGTPISTSMASHLIKGRAQVPKKLRIEVWGCSREELIDRLKLLEIQNVDACHQALVRLVQACGVNDATVKTLEQEANTEAARYAYIAEVFNLCTKCPKQSIRVLTDEDIELLGQLRFREVPELTAEPEAPNADTTHGNQRQDSTSKKADDAPQKEAPPPRVRVGSMFEAPENVSVREVVVTLPEEENRYVELFSDESCNGIINLDAADVLTMFHMGMDEQHEFRFFCFQGKRDAVMERIPDAFRGRTCDACMFNYIAGEDMGFMEIHEFAKILQEQSTPDGMLLFGAVYNPEMTDGYVEVWLLCSFVTEPELSYKDVEQAIYESLRDIEVEPPKSSGSLFEDTHELDPDEAFKDIEKIFRQREQEQN